MNKKWFFCFLFISLSIRCYPMPPFPQNHFDFTPFYAQIIQEIEKEFAHQNDNRTQRDTREYGYSFFKMIQGDFSYSPPPDFIQELGSLISQSFGHESKVFTNIILSLYEEGFHLEPHQDASFSHRFNNHFYFDENVYGIIIEPDPTGHLFFIHYEGNGAPPLDLEPIYTLDEKPGTIFCLQGDYRFAPFYHGVSPVSKRRISLTFRTVNIEGNSTSLR